MINDIEIQENLIDGIRELINIGIGKAAGSLNSMIDSHISLNVPEVRLIKRREVTDSIVSKDLPFSVVNLDYYGSFSGKTALLFPKESADNLILLLCGGDKEMIESSEVRKESLLEVGNILINAVMGSISNIIGEHLNYKIPDYQENNMDHLITGSYSSEIILLAVAKFQVKEHDINGDILMILEDSSIERLAKVINEKMG